MEEKYLTWYISAISCSLIINYSIFTHSRTLLLLWYLLQDLSPFLLPKALMWLREWKLMKDGAARNTNQKQICPGCTRQTVCKHPSTELAFRLCSSGGKREHFWLTGFYPLNNGKRPHSLWEALSRKQIQAGIYSMGPCTRYCWGAESCAFAVLLLTRNKCPASRWSLDSELLKG